MDIAKKGKSYEVKRKDMLGKVLDLLKFFYKFRNMENFLLFVGCTVDESLSCLLEFI